MTEHPKVVYWSKMASNEKRARKRAKGGDEAKESGKSVANVLIEAVLTDRWGRETKQKSYGGTT